MACSIETVEEVGRKVNGPEHGARPVHDCQDGNICQLECVHGNRKYVPYNQDETQEVPKHPFSGVWPSDEVSPPEAFCEGFSPLILALAGIQVRRQHAGQGSICFWIARPLPVGELLEHLKLVLRNIVIVIINMECELFPRCHRKTEDALVFVSGHLPCLHFRLLRDALLGNSVVKAPWVYR